jgi:PEP-CTERM motif-containing protein
LVSVAQNFGFTSGVTNGDSGGSLSPAWSVATTAVPEPASLGIVAIAAAGMVGRRRRTKA